MRRSAKLLSIASLILFAGCRHLPNQSHDSRCRQGITSINISSEAIILGGVSFGTVGQYKKLVGTAHGQVSPHASFNRNVVDLDEAPRNACGMVEYDVDLYIIRPVDPTKRSKTVLYEVLNRGRKLLLGNYYLGRQEPWLNEFPNAADAGDGFLMRRGYTLVWSGWQGDINNAPPNAPDVMGARYPVATNPDGGTITGTVRQEWVFTATTPRFTVPIGWDRGQVSTPPKPVPEHMANAVLLSRQDVDGPDTVIPRDQWSFGICTNGTTITPSDTDVCFPSGFQSNLIYNLVYTGQNPIVHGLSFISIRDVVSFLRSDNTSANPLSIPGVDKAVEAVIGVGFSQSGRVLRDGLNQGFFDRNQFDGLIVSHAAANLTYINQRFSQPGRFSAMIEGHAYPSDQFPFSYARQTDPYTGQTAGILDKCLDGHDNKCPKIFHIDGANEWWRGRASLNHTDPLGMHDIEIPRNVRMYSIAGVQHTPKMVNPVCAGTTNPLTWHEISRALLTDLEAWVKSGAEPPPSVWPSIDDTVAPATSNPESFLGTFSFPTIPGAPVFNGDYNHLYRNDQSVQPPVHIHANRYGVRVPKVDADGNEIAGIHSPLLRVPKGTHTGWTLRKPAFIGNRLCQLHGEYYPFPATAADRIASGDPRLSFVERYGTVATRQQLAAKAAAQLVAGGYLLEEDAARLVMAAGQ